MADIVISEFMGKAAVAPLPSLARASRQAGTGSDTDRLSKKVTAASLAAMSTLRRYHFLHW